MRQVNPVSQHVHVHVVYIGTSYLGHLNSGTTKFVPGKMLIGSLYMLPLLKAHLYSGEMDTVSRSRNQGLTSILGKPFLN